MCCWMPCTVRWLPAGITLAEVDGFNVTSSTQRFHSRQAVMLFGAQPSWTGSDIGIPAVVEAALAISAGLCETAVIATAQVAAHRDQQKTAPWTRPNNEFVECWGLFTPAEFALMARRHMHLYGTSEQQFAEVAATIRNNGARHPQACHYGKFVTPEDVLNSRMVAEPFHLLDCAMTSEGGAGMVRPPRWSERGTWTYNRSTCWVRAPISRAWPMLQRPCGINTARSASARRSRRLPRRGLHPTMWMYLKSTTRFLLKSSGNWKCSDSAGSARAAIS